MKKLTYSGVLLASVLLLVGCRPAEHTPSGGDVTLNTQAIRGVIQNTPYAVGQVYLISDQDTVVARSNVVNNTVDFDLTRVPSETNLTGNFTSGCQGQNSDPQARLYISVALNAYSTEGDLIGYVQEKPVGSSSTFTEASTVVRIYADRPVKFSGTCQMLQSNQERTIDIAVDLVKGWNAVLVTPRNNTHTLRMVPTALKTQLVMKTAPARVVLALVPDNLTFYNDSVTVQALFTRVGAYSGKVHLSTDVPGLSIEPETVILPKLTQKSVESLAYKQQLTFNYAGNESAINKPFHVIIRNDAGVEVGRSTNTFTVIRPGVQLSMRRDSSALPFIAQGDTGVLEVEVSSTNGFSGQVVIRLKDLPAGIEAAPVTVPVTQADFHKVVKIPVTVSRTVSVGQVNFTLTANVPMVDTPTGSFVVEPYRVSLGRPAIADMQWTGGDIVVVKGNTFLRLSGDNVMISSAAPDQLFRVQAGPNGSLWAKGVNGSAFYLFDKHQVKAFAAGGASSTESFAIDAQGRPWFFLFDGFHVPTLHYLDPVTGSVQVVTPVKRPVNAVALQHDRTGRYVFFESEEGKIVRVDTETLQSTESKFQDVIHLPGTYGQFKLDRNGELWYWTGGPGPLLVRFDPETFAVLQKVAAPMGKFVVEDSTTAWSLDDDKLTKFNLLDGTQTEIPFRGHALAITLAPERGIAYAYTSHSDRDSAFVRYVRQ